MSADIFGGAASAALELHQQQPGEEAPDPPIVGQTGEHRLPVTRQRQLLWQKQRQHQAEDGADNHPPKEAKEQVPPSMLHLIGSGFYDTRKNGVDLDFELERIVDEKVRQLQETDHEGARPFNQAMQQRIKRAGTCEACHGVDAAFWAKVKQKNGIEATPNDALHSEGIRKILERSAK